MNALQNKRDCLAALMADRCCDRLRTELRQRGTASDRQRRPGRGGVAIPAGHAHVHTHDGWWCDEHGVPEEICGQCSPKVAAEFQKKGDWCQEHDRPESQCFICHPELEAKFSAKYEAKFGKKPPQPEG